MADLAEFSQPGFDPKAWINSACTIRPPEEPLERFLAELEMKLQLTAEDVESALEASSNRLIQRIPSAVLEVARVKGDVGALQGDTRRIFEQLDASHKKAAAAVAPLASLDVVKSRMEGACNTLREATELSSLFASVEEVFATGNLPRVAEVLATMRRSLAAVGDVPEFNDGWKQLETLENRLQAMVEGPLAGAMAHKKSDMVRQLVDILVAIDRSAVVEKHYVAARMAPLLSFWEAFDRPLKDQTQQQQQQQAEHGGSFVAWLPRFYDEVLLGIEGEARWCAAVLPDLHPALLLSMLGSLFAKLSRSFAKRLQAAVEPSGALQPSSLAGVMAAQASGVHFARSLLGTLGGGGGPGLLPREQASALVATCLEAFAPYTAKYGQLEAALLSNEVMAIAAHTAVDEELDGVVAYLANSVPHMIQSVEQAVERCLKFTGGSEIAALLRVSDEALSHFCDHLIATVAAIRKRCISGEADAPEAGTKGAGEAAATTEDAWGGDYGDSAAKDVGPGEEAGAAAQLLGVSASLVGQLGVLEAQMHSVVSEAAAMAAKHGSPGAKQASPDPAEVAVARRLAEEPRLAAALAAMAEKVQDQRYNALPSSIQRASSFQQAVHSLLYDVLTFKVAEELKSIPRLGSWTEESGDNAFNLPSFSAYPLGYASAVGEYLMTLPQLLEAWMPGEDSEEPSHIDAEWLDKVATGTAELYTKQLLAIPRLSSKGAQQLAADLEYFCNVLSALSVAVPPALASVQLGAGLPDADYGPAVADALQQPFIDRRVFDQVLAMRGMAA